MHPATYFRLDGKMILQGYTAVLQRSRKYSNITLEKIYAWSRNLNWTQAKSKSCKSISELCGRICENNSTRIRTWSTILVRLAVNSLILGKVSNIRRVKLCPLLDKLRTALATGCRTNWAIKPFLDCDHTIVIRVSNIEKVAAKR